MGGYDPPAPMGAPPLMIHVRQEILLITVSIVCLCKESHDTSSQGANGEEASFILALRVSKKFVYKQVDCALYIVEMKRVRLPFSRSVKCMDHECGKCQHNRQ